MLDVRVLKNVDSILKKTCQIDEPFGGKIVLLSGDRRQLVPASGSEYSVFASEEYMEMFHHKELTIQMRQDPNASTFVEWLQKVLFY